MTGARREVLFALALACMIATEPAGAADLGGNCCADLEQRIAELERTTARKGNRPISLVIPNPGIATVVFSRGSFHVDLAGAGNIDITTPGTPFVLNGTTIAVLDVSSFTHEARMVLNLVQATDVPLSALLDDGHAGLWATALGGVGDFDGTTSAFAGEMQIGGGLFGYQGEIAPGLRAGVFLGLARSRLDVEENSEDLDSDFSILGFYGRASGNGLFFDFGALAGWSASDKTRRIATNIGVLGYSSVSSSYDGAFFSPSMGFGALIETGFNLTLIPAARARVTFTSLDGFAEQGGGSAATIGNRDRSDLEGRLELGGRSLVMIGAMPLSILATVGLYGRDELSSDPIDGVLLGQAIHFAADLPNSEFGGFGSLKFDLAVTPMANFQFGTEALFTDEETLSIIGFGTVRIGF